MHLLRDLWRVKIRSSVGFRIQILTEFNELLLFSRVQVKIEPSALCVGIREARKAEQETGIRWAEQEPGFLSQA